MEWSHFYIVMGGLAVLMFFAVIGSMIRRER
jgi:hypothetical protein